jgi:hypothetical protein
MLSLYERILHKAEISASGMDFVGSWRMFAASHNGTEKCRLKIYNFYLTPRRCVS